MSDPILVAEGPVLCFGGTYSNLHATNALFAAARRLGIPPARMICTGDVAAYCADPSATLDLLMRHGVPCIAGNCEESLAQDASDCGCGFAAGSACDVLSRAWYAHASRSVTRRQRAWMAGLPRRLVLRIGGRRLAVIHGGAGETSRFLFPSAEDAVLRAEIAAMGCDGVVAGHCGIPFTREMRGRLWHNPGAIGMPANDGTPRVWFSLLVPEPAGLRVEHRSLDYDHAGAAAAMRDVGLPAGYAAALETGLWPSEDVLPRFERDRRGTPIRPGTTLWRDAA